MEKFARFYRLQLKAFLKRGICWMQIICMVLLVGIAARIKLPDNQNVVVGIADHSSAMAKQIIELVQHRSNSYRFVVYEQEESLRQDVSSGVVECGFVFAPDFEKRYQEQNFEDSILYIATPFTTKGLAARETFYAAFLEVYGKDLILGQQDMVFGEQKEEIGSMLGSAYDAYLQSNDIFHTELTTVQNEAADRKDSDTYPLQGLIGIFVFMTIFLAGMSITGNGYRNLVESMEIHQRTLFQVTNLLAAATPVSLVGTLLSGFLPGSRGALMEIMHMFGLVVISCMEVLVIWRLQRQSATGKAMLLAFVVLQIILCPVFVDIGEFIPALTYVRYLLPLGYYL